MKKLQFKFSEFIGVVLLATAVGWYIDDWIGAASLVVLWLGFKLLVTGDRIPVLFLAFMFQWMQVSVGVFYLGFLGRQTPTIYLSDYRPMVLIGLGCVLSIAIGVRLGVNWIRRKGEASDDERPLQMVSNSALYTAYVIATVCEGSLLQLSYTYLSLHQIFLTMTVARLGLLFLIMRRLCHPKFRWAPFTALLVVEVGMGFTGYFAGFREPLILGVLALLEIFNPRKSAHLASFAGLIVVMLAASVMWMGVRNDFRKEFNTIDAFSTSQSSRIDRISSLGTGFFQSDFSDMVTTLDSLVDRMWVVYYPALAVSRVPLVVAHTDGAIMAGALVHIVTPRVFFPNKPPLTSDSEMVRKYSGIWVAGQEQNTSIAFGYAAEAYVDFGLPFMFVPPLLFGLGMGLAYAFFVKTIWHRELAVAIVTVIFWLGMYLFERSWANLLGYALSLLVYLGLPSLMLDKLMMPRDIAKGGVLMPDLPQVADNVQ